jgi:hypothetical protein
MRGFAAAMRLRAVLASVAFSFATGMAGAADLQEPITLQSSKGVLDILLVAKTAPVPSLSPFNPTGWAYDVCPNPHNGANDPRRHRCPRDLPALRTDASGRRGSGRIPRPLPADEQALVDGIDAVRMGPDLAARYDLRLSRDRRRLVRARPRGRLR